MAKSLIPVGIGEHRLPQYKDSWLIACRRLLAGIPLKQKSEQER